MIKSDKEKRRARLKRTHHRALSLLGYDKDGFAQGDDHPSAGKKGKESKGMRKGRVKVLSDAVIAIIITIKVLELKVTHGLRLHILFNFS